MLSDDVGYSPAWAKSEEDVMSDAISSDGMMECRPSPTYQDQPFSLWMLP